MTMVKPPTLALSCSDMSTGDTAVAVAEVGGVGATLGGDGDGIVDLATATGSGGTSTSSVSPTISRPLPKMWLIRLRVATFRRLRRLRRLRRRQCSWSRMVAATAVQLVEEVGLGEGAGP